jgi:hypothetical protein
MNSINILFSQGDINKNASIKSYKFVSPDRCKALIRHSIDVELKENVTYTLDGFLARCETKLDKLKRKLSDLESKLYEEQSRQHEMIESRGFGYGMRHSKIGFSTKREDLLKERIKEVKEQIKQLSNI